MITEVLFRVLRYVLLSIVTPEGRNSFVEEVSGELTEGFVEFEGLELVDHWKRLGKTRVVVNQDKKALVLSNRSHLYFPIATIA